MKLGRPVCFTINLDVLKEMIEVGFNKYEIADFFGCSWNTIDKVILQNNLSKPKRKMVSFSTKELNVIKEIKENDNVIYRACKRCNIDYASVYHIAKKYKEYEQVEKRKQEWLTNNAKYVEKD